MHKEQISNCSILGISLEDFFDIGLSAMSENKLYNLIFCIFIL